MDKLEFVCTLNTDIQDVETTKDSDKRPERAVNLMGLPVNSAYHGIIIKNGKKYHK